MISWTSRLALRALVENLERHQGQRYQVYLAVRDWPGAPGPSREDIAKVTGIRLSSVCGRVAELLRDGALEKGPMKPQEVVLGHPQMVETLRALVYCQPPRQANPQLELFAA
jgi:hypothetical protein